MMGGWNRLTVAAERQVLDLLASGVHGLQVAALTGVSKSKVYALRQQAGGVFRPANASYDKRYLCRENRYEIARLRDQQLSVRQIATRIGRAASTVSRELRRNARASTGNYEPEHADRLAWERQRRPKPSKLSRHPVLREKVQELLDKRYSPDQVSGRLKLLHPNDPLMRVSHETIYQSLYVYPRGELKRELKAHLRRGRALRQRRGGTERRGQIRDAVSIHDRPEEIESRLVPGHHEGDLIMGSSASNSAVGTIVERTTGRVVLVPLPEGHTADKVADAVIAQMSALPPWFAKTLTWDRGHEMAGHAKVTAATNIAVYFADPYCPYQRGSNENTNGLLREYLPKGSDLSAHTAAELRAIADELNDRPRKRLGYHTPNEAFANLLAQEQARVATTT
jgi:IS30 family transposase